MHSSVHSRCIITNAWLRGGQNVIVLSMSVEVGEFYWSRVIDCVFFLSLCAAVKNVICSRSSSREVTCYKLDSDNLVLVKKVKTTFDLATGSNPLILCIVENNLIIGMGTNILIQPLQGSVGNSSVSVKSSLVDAIEVYGHIYVLFQTASGSATYGVLQWDSTQKVWSSPEYIFAESEGLFNRTPSNVLLHLDSWGQLYAIYGQQKELVVNQLPSGPVFRIAAPTQCQGITRVSSSANGRDLLVHCAGSFFIYSLEDAMWLEGSEHWGDVYKVEDVKELADPRVFAVPTLTNPNCSLPGTVAFLALDGQRVIVSLRAGSLTGSTFTQAGHLFCYSEDRASGVLCHNVSVLLSGGATGSTASYLYETPNGAIVVGSIGSKVVVEYVDTNTGDSRLDVLPRQSKNDDTRVEIDRKSLCDEIKNSVPSLFKLFCDYKK